MKGECDQYQEDKKVRMNPNQHLSTDNFPRIQFLQLTLNATNCKDQQQGRRKGVHKIKDIEINIVAMTYQKNRPKTDLSVEEDIHSDKDASISSFP